MVFPCELISGGRIAQTAALSPVAMGMPGGPLQKAAIGSTCCQNRDSLPNDSTRLWHAKARVSADLLSWGDLELRLSN